MVSGALRHSTLLRLGDLSVTFDLDLSKYTLAQLGGNEPPFLKDEDGNLLCERCLKPFAKDQPMHISYGDTIWHAECAPKFND